MIYYASRTGTKANLAAMREIGVRLLVSRAGVWRTEGFPYALDNGAWSDFTQDKTFDEDAFERLIEKLGAGADWIVLPDIVAGGLKSLALSTRFLNRTLSLCPLVLIAVQDGMEQEDVEGLVGPNVGIFLGGSTEWKLKRMEYWGRFCARRGVHYHVARVNTVKRIRMAIAAGATSADGSRLSRFSQDAPLIARALREQDLFNPLLEDL